MSSSALQLSTASNTGEGAGLLFMVLNVHCKTTLLN